MSTLRLFNGSDKQLYKSASVMEVFVFGELSKDDILDIEYTLMERTDSDAEPWTIADPSSYALRMGFFTGAGCAQLAYQNSFTDDIPSGKKIGTLSLADAAMGSALAALEKFSPTFEIQVQDATGIRTMYRKAVVITKHCISSGTLTVPPTETAATESWVKALFVPRDGEALECDQIVMLSRPSGLRKVLWIDDDNILHITAS